MRVLIFLLISLSLIQCKQSVEKSVQQTLPDDFEAFFIEFHVDSAYQFEHIIFPLEGVRKSADKQSNEMIPYNWTRENWLIHKPFSDFGGTFDRSFHLLGHVVIEKITGANGIFKMERRFAKIDGEWYLIFYGINN